MAGKKNARKRSLEASLQRLRDDNTDAVRLTPGAMAEERAYDAALEEEAARADAELREADAKNRLYALLLERTRREHMAMDQEVRMGLGGGVTRRDGTGGREALLWGKGDCLLCQSFRLFPGHSPYKRTLSPIAAARKQQVRAKQASRRDCAGDLRALTAHFHAARAAREEAERDLAAVSDVMDGWMDGGSVERSCPTPNRPLSSFRPATHAREAGLEHSTTRRNLETTQTTPTNNNKPN